MNMISKAAGALALAAAATLSAGGAAQACAPSLLANALCQTGLLTEQQANDIHQVYRASGGDRAVQQGAAALMNSYYPGSGVAASLWAPGNTNTGGFQSSPRSQPAPPVQSPPSVLPLPPERSTRNGASYGSTGQSGIGNLCVTPAGSLRIAPAPIGYPCWVGTAWGPVTGQIVPG